MEEIDRAAAPDWLDGALRIWATHDFATGSGADAVADRAAAAIRPGPAAVRRAWPFAGGALMAAAVAGISALAWPAPAPDATPPAALSAHRHGLSTEAALGSFALLYTPTWEEEQYL
jgi:hypothetical protein